MGRRIGSSVSLVAIVAVVLSTLVVVPGAAGAQDGPDAPTLSTNHVVESRDFASQAWADPWDFSSPDDLILVSNVGYLGLDDVEISDGLLSFTTGPEGSFFPHTALMGIPHGRDGEGTPIDGNTYRRLSMRIWSGAAGTAMGRVWWFNDPGGLAHSGGTQVVQIRPGWQTIDVSLATDDPNHPQPWVGNQIMRLRIQPEWSTSLGPFDVSVDWVRVYEPATELVVQVPDDAVELWWDADDDPGDNGGPGDPGRGAGEVPGHWTGPGSVEVNVAALPPGTYRFFSVDGQGVPSEYSEPLVIDARPAPLVHSPDEAGGEDWATVVRGDAWDMSQPTDIQNVTCSQVSFIGGVLHGNDVGFKCGPYQNAGDVGVELATPMPIDASIWHRVTYDLDYDGPFDLGFDAGGGTMSRLIWRTVNPGPAAAWHDSQDIVVVPGGRTITVDFHTNPRSAIEDESSASGEKLGWGVPGREIVDALRFEPHEDVGGRTWRLSEVRLARNDSGGNSFEVVFEDRAWEPGTTADLYARKHGVAGRTLIASALEVTEGLNSFVWDGLDAAGGFMGPGTYEIDVEMTDPGGNTGSARSTGPVDLGSPFWDIAVTHPFAWEIGWFADAGLTTGFDDGSFRAGGTLTRQAMAAFLYRQQGSPNGTHPGCTSSPAWDVPVSHPFCGEIAWMLASGASTGFEDGGFHPSGTVTRQAMAAFLYRQEGAVHGADPGCGSAPMWDVPVSHPFCGEIAWMLAEGITTGFEDGGFHPGANLTRQAMAAFTYRLSD